MAVSTFVCLCLATSICGTLARSRTKYASPKTVYDQKQTGDYNIQVHLKDFQIIALLSDGELGEYDYNYDYDDFTIKPGSSSTSTSTTTTTSTTSTTTSSPTSFPSIIPQKLGPSSETPTLNVHPNDAPSSTHKPILEPPELNNATLAELEKFEKNVTGILLSALTYKKPTEENPKPVNEPGRIKVQILEGPTSAPSGAVPGEEVVPHLEGEVPQVEVLQKRCLNGYTRDKKGRCRRVRRPPSQLPFGFGRLASNLVSRFRTSESAAASAELTEN